MSRKDIGKKLIKNKKQIVYIVGGLICLSVGFVLAMLWSEQRDNMFLTMAIILLFPSGAFLVYRGWNKTTDIETVIVGQKKVTTPVNSLNIYAKKDRETGKIYPEKVVFEMLPNPMGQPQQCTNNGKWYHVHIWDLATNKLSPFVLPDSQFFDPREFANVIKMPAHKKLFSRKMSMIQKIGPWVMVVAFLISIIGMVITAPAPGG